MEATSKNFRKRSAILAYLQATNEVRQELPVLTTVGRYVQKNGELVETPDEAGQQALKTFRNLEYYYGTNFKY